MSAFFIFVGCLVSAVVLTWALISNMASICTAERDSIKVVFFKHFAFGAATSIAWLMTLASGFICIYKLIGPF